MAEYAGRFIAQWTVVATQNSNTAATATKAGVGIGRHFITGYSVSCSAAPATTVSLSLTNGATTVERVELPAALFAPIVVNFQAPIRCDINSAAAISCPAVGGTTRSTVTLRGFTTYE
jgi:hypothetical protein